MSSTVPKATDLRQWLRPLSPTILLVEDDPAVREVTREALEIGGYRVLEASGPEEAAHIAAEPSTQVDLLLTDVVMPGMSGFDLARRVGEMRPDLVTIFMSGYGENDATPLPMHGVLRDRIQKPFTVDSLLSRVAYALASRWDAGKGTRPMEFPSP